MLTDDELVAIKSKYGACNDDALREAARMIALRAIPVLKHVIMKADIWHDADRGGPCPDMDRERAFLAWLRGQAIRAGANDGR